MGKRSGMHDLSLFSLGEKMSDRQATVASVLGFVIGIGALGVITQLMLDYKEPFDRFVEIIGLPVAIMIAAPIGPVIGLGSLYLGVFLAFLITR